ncbi:MAG: NAD(P)H-dependent flavin oxidoreductase, partial [Halanaerobiaceae bacterium]
TNQNSRDIISKIKEKINIPVIAAGDIITPREVSEMFSQRMDGVQMGTRFLASRESSVADYFKELCVKTKKEDVLTIMSSAGLPANAIRTRFSELIKAGQTTEPEICDNCLKHCTRTFCVKDALIRGKEGDKDKGLFFTGKGIEKINEILSVKQIFRNLIEY